MPSTWPEIQKEYDDMRRQSLSDWKERVLRVEEPFINPNKEVEEKAHEAECLNNFIEMAHNNPEWHMKIMAKELEHETFCHTNRLPYSPSYPNGLPGYWDYRKANAEDWILNKRDRLPHE